MKKNNSVLINQTSGNLGYEYYTPSYIVDCARDVMGSIELDPASSIVANQIVLAERFYTIEDNGLSKDWIAKTCWMNHPFNRKTNAAWIEKLISEFRDSNIDQAMCITYASTSEKWFRSLLWFPQCYLYGRTNYRLPDGTIKKGVTKGSVITFLTRSDKQIDRFRWIFDTRSRMGKVKI